MPGSSFAARCALACVATAIAGATAVLLLQRQGAGGSTLKVTVDPGTAPETSWDGQAGYVEDAIAGLRPRRSSSYGHPMTAFGGGAADTIQKRRCAHGFLRRDDLPPSLERPSVLVVGDSHTDGVVSTEDNFTSLLEAACRPPCYVLNAGCGFYSLWQSVLRARDLGARYRPKVVVIVVFLGNDFLELDQVTMPHLDDDLREQPPGPRPTVETTSARQRELALPAPFPLLFWQGLNQALYLHQDPARQERLLQKAAHAVDAMQLAAAAQGAHVLWALLPSFDLVFAERVADLSPLAAAVVRGGAQRRLRDGFAALLAQRGADVVDLEPDFRADGEASLYAADFHVYRRGHACIARALQAPIERLLTR